MSEKTRQLPEAQKQEPELSPLEELDEASLNQVVGGATSKENIVFSSVSNVLKTRHDTIKNSIGN